MGQSWLVAFLEVQLQWADADGAKGLLGTELKLEMEIGHLGLTVGKSLCFSYSEDKHGPLIGTTLLTDVIFCFLKYLCFLTHTRMSSRLF